MPKEPNATTRQAMEQARAIDNKLVVTYDPERGCSYIYLAGHIPPEKARASMAATRDINLDFDEDGHLIGIELLREGLLHPMLAAKSVPPGEKY